MGHRTAREGHRVLVVAPYGRDAQSVVRLLGSQGYDAHACADLNGIADALNEHVGVILLTQEAMAFPADRLKEALTAQAPWSDVPFILLASRSTGQRSASDAVRERLVDFTGNVIVLERPLGQSSLISATASAMRSRQRQFDMRDRLLELEQGRAALAASERELRTVADALPTLIAFVDRDQTYRFANRAYETWFGVRPETVVGRHVRELVGDEGYAVRADGIARALAGEAVRLEVPWPHLDGRRRDAEIRYIPRRADDGTIDGFHIFVLDVTDRKLTEETLSQHVAERTAELEQEMTARTEAESALRQSHKMEAVGQLTGGIAHDFNNMLTGVIGSLDIIRRRIAAGRFDDLDRFMDAATTSAQRAAGLTARLLAFSRRQSLDERATDLNRLLLSLEELLRHTVRENITLSIVPGDDVGSAMTDANQLENAILNLAINARDAMPDGGALTIASRTETLEAQDCAGSALEPGRYAVIDIADTGVGIPPEVLDKVFDPFFTTKPIGQGTGLGLSMVYGFARQSRGEVRVHSRPGAGTTVSLYLRASAAAEDSTADPSVETVTGAGQTVLLVEDDAAVRLLVSDLLAELSYQVLEADAPDAAIVLLQSDRAIDLMVSDVGLPGMNGRQLAEVARQHRPTLPILFVTGYAENATIRSEFLGPNMAMITKPFALNDLSAKIRDMLT